MSNSDGDPPAGRVDVFEGIIGDQILRIQTVLPKESPYYKAIGRVASYWTHFEHILDEIIWDISQVPEDIAICITGQMMGATPRFKAIDALGKHVGLPKELLKKATNLKGRQYDVAEDRNRVVHDPWYYVREQGKADAVTQLKASPPGHAPASEDEINDLIQRIRKLIIEAAELQVEFARAMYALRSRRP